MKKGYVPYSFNGKNLNAQARARAHAGTFVTGVSAATHEAIRAVILRSIRDQIPPLVAAKLIRDVVGLDTQRAQAVYTYRLGLQERGIFGQRADALVERYADQKLRDRAETIARTEVMEALNSGSEEAARQAQEEGLLDNPVKEVQVTDDELTCPICEEMDGQEVPLGQQFSRPGPPFHPTCRCTFAVTEGSQVVVRG